jgi:hypothetical protein
MVAIALAAQVVAPPLAAQSGRDQPPRPPTFTSGVNLVEVDVTATDRAGRFVRDLTRDDFEIFEDGKRQDASAFELVDLPYAPRPPVAVASATLPRVEADVRTNAGAPTGRVFVLVQIGRAHV